jgi:hypothetical protein
MGSAQNWPAPGYAPLFSIKFFLPGRTLAGPSKTQQLDDEISQAKTGNEGHLRMPASVSRTNLQYKQFPGSDYQSALLLPLLI